MFVKNNLKNLYGTPAFLFFLLKILLFLTFVSCFLLFLQFFIGGVLSIFIIKWAQVNMDIKTRSFLLSSPPVCVWLGKFVSEQRGCFPGHKTRYCFWGWNLTVLVAYVWISRLHHLTFVLLCLNSLQTCPILETLADNTTLNQQKM